MSKKVFATCGVYASGKKLSMEKATIISDDDYQILSRMKKVRLVEEAKKEAKKPAKEVKKNV